MPNSTVVQDQREAMELKDDTAKSHALERTVFSESEPHWTHLCSCGEKVTANDAAEVARLWFEHRVLSDG